MCRRMRHHHQQQKQKQQKHTRRVPCRASLTTRDRMRRDREVHRLGLRAVEDIPRDVLIDLTQVRAEVCACLRCSLACLFSGGYTGMR